MKLNMPELPPAQLLSALKNYNLLPAIVFLPTRRKCDQSASEAASAKRDDQGGRRDARRDFLRSFVEEHPEVRNHRHWDAIIKSGVASHHAGHTPAWKLAIEKLMSAGLLDAIFATMTVAAGVDFPARTVVVTNADARTGHGWRLLTASELQQMTGRAGRRGKDRVGFIVVAPGLHQNPALIAELLQSQPDPLESQFRATYSTLLNLLDAYQSFAHVREIAERSFAHRDMARRINRLEKEILGSEREMKRKLEEAGCDLPIEVARGLERLASARSRLLEKLPQTRAEVMMNWLDEQVLPGRIVATGRRGRRLVLVIQRRGQNFAGMREDGRGVNLSLDRVARVFGKFYPLKEDAIEQAFDEVRTKANELAIEEPKLKDVRSEEDDAVEIINNMIDRITPGHINEKDKQRCAEALWSVIADAEAVEKGAVRIEALRNEVWRPFELRARVLDHFGYLDFAGERVTERGKWLADLHVDRTLLVGEAVDKGLFDKLDVPRAAGLMAALAADEDRDYGELELGDSLVTVLARFDEVAYAVATEEWRQGLEPAPEINFSAAATASRWAGGADWTKLVEETRAEEGDLIRMLSRTGESLLQIAGLKHAKPVAARVASQAAEATLREPVR